MPADILVLMNQYWLLVCHQYANPGFNYNIRLVQLFSLPAQNTKCISWNFLKLAWIKEDNTVYMSSTCIISHWGRRSLCTQQQCHSTGGVQISTDSEQIMSREKVQSLRFILIEKIKIKLNNYGWFTSWYNRSTVEWHSGIPVQRWYCNFTL